MNGNPETVTERLRDHLLQSLGYAARVPRMPALDTLRRTEWCEEFEQARRNRMIMGAFRYGLLTAPGKFDYDLLAGLQKKLDDYHRTGNVEALVDAGNYLMMEFMRPSHPNSHFRAEDDHNHCPRKQPQSHGTE